MANVLRAQLRGHEREVIGIGLCGGDFAIASSSKDGTVALWRDDSGKFNREKILIGHTTVRPLWISPSDAFQEGGIVSGGLNGEVSVWDLSTLQKRRSLIGHQLEVTGVVFDEGYIVSSSADGSVRRWRWHDGELVEVWQAHEKPIHAIMKLHSGEIVTGTVQGLVEAPGSGILSASHDGSIRLWAPTGEVLTKMVGHTSKVYSVDSHASGLIVSGSEDGSTKVWKDGLCIQSIEHPGCVWDAKFLGDGDFVTACADVIVRIWTAHQDRFADPQERDAYASQLSQYKGSRKGVVGLQSEDLPGLEALQVPGTGDGQKKVVREGDDGVGCSSNLREQQWDKFDWLIQLNCLNQ